MEMFEKATRLGIRFETTRGILSVEDLWNMPLLSNSSDKFDLNTVAVGIYNKIKENGEISFVGEVDKKNELESFKLDVVKYIIQVKQDETKAENDRLAAKARNAKIAAIIERKEDEDLQNLSVEKLKEMIK